METLIPLGLLMLLFIITRMTRHQIMTLAHRVTRSHTITAAILSLLLYPGTVVHELAHLLAAVVLFVPVKSLNLEPKIHHGYIRAGSVVTNQTDWFRQAIISIAPLPIGITVLWAITTYLFPTGSTISGQLLTTLSPNIPTITLLFLLFTISATMFPSTTDIKLLNPLVRIFILPFFIFIAVVILTLIGTTPMFVTLFTISLLLHIIVFFLVFFMNWMV